MRARAERERDAGGVDSNPTTSPLLRDVGRGTGATGWVED